MYSRSIDRATYERQRDVLREQIARIRLELEDARVEEIDVEGPITFGEYLLGNAARVWQGAELSQRQALQRALFPEGVRLEDGRIGTAATCLAFRELRAFQDDESRMASPTGFEPVSWP
jgi:hypothetical protein